MRVLASLSALFLLPLALSRQEPLQVYLYPTPTSLSPAHATVPTLSAQQAKAVLSHHLGEELNDFDEIPSDEGMWAYLLNLWEDEKEGKARVVVLDGGVSPQDVLPTTLPASPAFYLSDNSATQTLLAPYISQAKTFLAEILEALPSFAKSFKDVFDLAGTKAAELLGQELAALTALSDSVSWLHRDGSYPWTAITISGLKDVHRGDEVWETGRQGVKAGLEAMTAPNSPPLLIIIRPSSSRSLGTRAAPLTLTMRDSNVTLADTCYTSNETCAGATDCNGRGACALKGKSEDSECWGCKCAAGYAGVECQKDDYSVPFIMLIFSTLLLVGIAVGSIGLLYTVGESKLPSTLTLAIGGSAKRD